MASGVSAQVPIPRSRPNSPNWSSWPTVCGRAGAAARKITVLGTASNESITLTALALARLVARHGKVVVVDLSASSPTLQAASVDPVAPGLTELMLRARRRSRKSSPG